MTDIAWIQHRSEGQFFERKSCYDRSTGAMKRRKAGEVARDIAEKSKDIKELIRKGIVNLPQPGGRIYELVIETITITCEKPKELILLEPILHDQGYIKNQDIRDALNMTKRQATAIAEKLVNNGWLVAEGERRWRRYIAVGRNISKPTS